MSDPAPDYRQAFDALAREVARWADVIEAAGRAHGGMSGADMISFAAQMRQCLRQATSTTSGEDLAGD